MTELKFEIPKELESEFKIVPKVELSIFISRILKGNLSRVVKFKEIVSKSKLTEEQAEELADDVTKSLADRYDKLVSKK